MDKLEICWFIFFVCGALWAGAKASDFDMKWAIASVCAGFLAVFTAHGVVAGVFSWFQRVIPSPTSALNPITAAILTLVLCGAFVMTLSLTGTEFKTFASKLLRSKPN